MTNGPGLEAHIEKCRALFGAAFPGEDETFDRICRQVRAGRAFIELSQDGKSFAVLQPVRDLHVWTVGGDMAGVMELEATISASAAKKGFDRMTALPSRENWDRALRARGWKPEAKTPLVKEL